jgi:hypothetical protein
MGNSTCPPCMARIFRPLASTRRRAPNETVKPIFPLSLLSLMAWHMPPTSAQHRCRMRKGKSASKHSSWSNHHESARHHQRQPLSSSASVPPNALLPGALLITAIQLAVHGARNRGWALYSRADVGAPDTSRAMPAHFSQFSRFSIHGGRVCPDDDCGLSPSLAPVSSQPHASVPCPLFAGSVLRPVPVVSHAHRAIREPLCLTAARALRLGARFGRDEDI